MSPETPKAFSRKTKGSSKGLQHGELKVSRDPVREAGSGLINLREKHGFLQQLYYIYILIIYSSFLNFYEILDF